MQLTGHRSETQLSPAQAAALRRALDELEPHEDHLVVGGVAHAVRGALGGSDDAESELSKAMQALDRVELRKIESPRLRDQIVKAQRTLQVAYLEGQPGAWSDPDQSAHLEAVRKREAGLRAA